MSGFWEKEAVSQDVDFNFDADYYDLKMKFLKIINDLNCQNNQRQKDL
jgi:hypothetical protein